MPLQPTGDQKDIDMTQIMAPKSCLHNLINLQFPHSCSHRAVPRSYCVDPHAQLGRRITAHHSKILCLSFLFPQITTESVWCMLLGQQHALAHVIFKQAQTGEKKADSLSCTICHMAAKPSWYGPSLGHSQRLLVDLFYSRMCLCLGWKCKPKSLPGSCHAEFTDLAQPM